MPARILDGPARRVAALAPLVAACCLACIACLALRAAPSFADAQEHVEIIDQPQASYAIDLGGTLDAQNTRTEQGYTLPWTVGFQPNRYISIANIGRENVETPWVSVDGRGASIRDADLVSAAIAPGMSDQEKVLALWAFLRPNYYRMDQAWGPQYLDPVVSLSTYGYGECVTAATLLGLLAEATGFQANTFGDENHYVSEIWWDGKPHIIDLDRSKYVLHPGGELYAPDEIVRDHHPSRQTHLGWIGEADDREADSLAAEIWDVTMAPSDLYQPPSADMSYTLRPGETLYRSWQNWGKFSSYGDGPGSLGIPPGLFGNGSLDYRPELADTLFRAGMEEVVGLNSVAQDSLLPELHPQTPGTPGDLILKMSCPYVIVGGAIQLAWRRNSMDDLLKLFVSRDGQLWQPMWSADGLGTGTAQVSLDAWVDPNDNPYLFNFWVKMVISAGAENPITSVGLDSLAVTGDFQLAPAMLPSLVLGANHVTYRDAHQGTRLVKITHGWEESSATRPPYAPVPIAPLPGLRGVSPRPVFSWNPAGDPDGDAIADYEIQVSERADMRWPVSANFDRYLSKTPYAGGTSWQPPYDGLLRKDAGYYWRVRAKDVNGAWGPWTNPVNFTVGGPPVPDSLAVQKLGTEVTLSWRVPGGGTPPVAYRVYGADEEGFSPDSLNLVASVVKSPCLVGTAFPSLPNQNRCFYRVVSVDSARNAGAASDYLELPHPVIPGLPPVTLTASAAYSYALGAHAVRKFDRLPHDDSLAWSATTVPAWLSLSPGGVLGGTPSAADSGVQAVRVDLGDGHGGQTHQEFAIRVSPSGSFSERIPLGGGLNVLSWPESLAITTPSRLLAPLMNNLDYVMGYDGAPLFFSPAPGDSSLLTSLDNHHAYWFKMRAPDTLEISGKLKDPQWQLIPLEAGWNLVPFLPYAADSTTHALAGLGANLLAAMSTADTTAVALYDPSLPDFSTLRLLQPLAGYWIDVASADTLRYPSDTANPIQPAVASRGRGQPPAGDPSAVSPFWGMIYGQGIQDKNGGSLTGLAVRIYDPDGILCGQAAMDSTGGFPLVPLWQDDPGTQADEGASPGDTLVVVIGDRKLVPSPVYRSFGVRIAVSGSLAVRTSVDGARQVPPRVLGLVAATPQNLRGTVRFRLSLPGTGPSTLSLYSVEGRLVRELRPAEGATGEVDLQWDGNDSRGGRISPGIYVAVLEQSRAKITRKLVFVR